VNASKSGLSRTGESRQEWQKRLRPTVVAGTPLEEKDGLTEKSTCFIAETRQDAEGQGEDAAMRFRVPLLLFLRKEKNYPLCDRILEDLDIPALAPGGSDCLAHHHRPSSGAAVRTGMPFTPGHARPSTGSAGQMPRPDFLWDLSSLP